ncbi:MAG: NUDIX domain-containing protein [Rhodobacteraceae bacterium]|nr:NUDIX domain-containing protein [Paracoccaceae bacterium]
MLVRAAAALRAAAEGGPGGPADGAVEVLARSHPFRGFFGIEDLLLRHRRFDGSMGPAIRREVFVMTDAVTVLPYDPVHDLVLAVEQFRAGAVGRGGGPIWHLEAIAGRIDPGETPEDTARREAAEEAGLVLGALLPVAGYYPSPGACTEYIHSFVALCDLGAAKGGLHGVADEGEDIRTHVLAFDAAAEALAAGRIINAPLLISLLWLMRERPRLRAGAGI